MRIGDRTKHADSIAAEGINRNVIKIGNETKQCTPLDQYPVDTWTLVSSFASKEIARKYLTRHWESWVTEETIAKIASAGLTHVKIPIGHWILGDIRDGEPWVDGEWKYFRRAVRWCRKYGLQVIADIHTAPGSQNGFDNSGQLLSQKTARHWSSHPDRIARSVKVVGDVARAVKDKALDDVVTGIEILNEIYSDANITTVKHFYEDSFEAVREHLPRATVVASDNFDAGQFNGFWTDPSKYKDTLLDTHLYTVFSEKLRAMSPKQHVAFICGNHYNIELMKCCWDDDGRSQGLGRIIGEWTASYDTLVASEINVVFDEIVSLMYSLLFSASAALACSCYWLDYISHSLLSPLFVCFLSYRRIQDSRQSLIGKYLLPRCLCCAIMSKRKWWCMRVERVATPQDGFTGTLQWKVESLQNGTSCVESMKAGSPRYVLKSSPRIDSGTVAR